MNQLHINQHTLTLPSNINDLNRRQLLDVADIVQNKTEGIKALWLLFLSLLGQKYNLKQQLWALWHIYLKPAFVKSWVGKFLFVFIGFDVTLIHFTNEQLYDCINTYTDFLFNDKSPLITQRFKKIRIGIHQLVGPDDALEGITFAQWREAEEQYYLYATTQDPTALNRLLAVLWYQTATQRLWSWLLNRPISVSEATLQRRSLQIAKLPVKYRLAMLLYFQGCKELIVDSHKHFFVRKKKKDDTPDYAIRDVYQATLHHIANRDPEQYERKDKLPLYYVLFALEQNGIEAERINKELEEQKRKAK